MTVGGKGGDGKRLRRPASQKSSHSSRSAAHGAPHQTATHRSTCPTHASGMKMTHESAGKGGVVGCESEAGASKRLAERRAMKGRRDVPPSTKCWSLPASSSAWRARCTSRIAALVRIPYKIPDRCMQDPSCWARAQSSAQHPKPPASLADQRPTSHRCTP